MIAVLRELAASVGGPSVVFTFEPHPVRILRPEVAPPPLTWIERKAELLAELGVDVVVACPTTAELLSLTADQFFSEVVQQKLHARAMVEGPNFYFGKDREGDIVKLGGLCDQADVQLKVVEPVKFGEADGATYVSSSRVRDALKAGDAAAAAEMLGRPYRLRGMVTHGAGRGATIGFPTANLDAIDTLTPGQGVYAARSVVNGQRYPTAVNIGPNPTFGESAIKVECHLIGYQGTLYGQPLEIDFLHQMRPIQTFGGVEQLKEQLTHDIQQCRQIVQRQELKTKDA